MILEPLISVIIPVYNVEDFLHKSIDSVINQTYRNLEIILIDDGSTDNCGQICDDYSKFDSRVITIHKVNGGQGSARNLGLRKCTGEFIAFLDSDDYLESDAIRSLYDLLISENLDISSCNYNRVDVNGNLLSKFDSRFDGFIVTGLEAQIRMWYGEVINLSPWGKLYKHTLWNGIEFEERRNSEDYATMHNVYLKAERFGYTPEPYVNYTIRMNSSVRVFYKDKIEILDIADDTICFSLNKGNELYKASIAKAVATYLHILMKLPSLRGEYSDVYHRCKIFLSKHKKDIISDKRVSKRTKYAVILCSINPSLARKIYLLRKRKDVLS